MKAMDIAKFEAEQAKEADFTKRVKLKCEELACEFFEKSDDLAAVSFALRETIMRRWLFVQEREKAERERRQA